MKKQNLRKKALFPAVSMALASIIALSGVTYAWFTKGDSASLQNLYLDVQEAQGVEISLNAVDWKSSFIGEEVSTASYVSDAGFSSVTQYPIGTINPVSSSGKLDNGKMKMYLGEVKDVLDGEVSKRLLTSTQQTDVNGTDKGNYIAFDVFVKNSSGKAQTLSLGTSSDVKDAKGTAGASKAARVGFVHLGNTTDGSEAAMNLNNSIEDNVTIWEPNATSHVGEYKNSSNAVNYKGLNAEFKEADKVDLTSVFGETAPDTTYTSAVNGLVRELKDVGEDTNINWSLPANSITKIRIYIWLEGQDVDCINEVSYSDISTTLQFKVPTTATE